jgi:hypothetical protein
MGYIHYLCIPVVTEISTKTLSFEQYANMFRIFFKDVNCLGKEIRKSFMIWKKAFKVSLSVRVVRR